MYMVIVGMLAWWYTSGLHRLLIAISSRFVGVFDYFSIDLLITTLFSPYRQISAGKVDGPIGLQLRALVDNLLSRVIGAVLRSIVMVIGAVTLVVLAVFSLMQVVAWIVVPSLPVVGLVLMLIGWLPWTL